MDDAGTKLCLESRINYSVPTVVMPKASSFLEYGIGYLVPLVNAPIRWGYKPL